MKGTMKVAAPAKLNLALAVLGRRGDGYHQLSSVMQQISLADVLVLQGKESPGWSFYCTDTSLNGEDNLVCQAAGLLGRLAGKNLPGVKLTLYKRIPVEAGLAGGSSDAAAALTALNKFWQLNLTRAELLDLGAQLGSDVPYCIQGGTALVGGRGEEVHPLPDIPPYWVVLAVPSELRLSTAAVYGALNLQASSRPEVEELVEAITSGSVKDITAWYARGVVNTLEDAVLPRSAAVVDMKEKFRAMGLLPAMSGSGPSVFALTGSLPLARQAVEAIQKEGHRAYLCWTIKYSDDNSI